MKTVDAVDNEIRFTATWDGIEHIVFIPDPYVSDDAGHSCSRDEAISYVRANLDRYVAEAQAQSRNEPLEKIIILAR